MTSIKTILFAGAVALGMGACHHDRAVNTPANNTYGTSGDQTPGAPAPVEGSYNSSTGNATTNPDVNGTGQTGAAGVQSNTDTNATGTGTAPAQNQTTSPSAGTLNSTDNASRTNQNNNDTNGARQKGNYNNVKNSVPSSTNGSNVNTDSDMDRTGNSGTTKEGNPGTADQPDR